MTTVPQTIDLTFRLFVLILATTVGLLFVFAGARAALSASLRPSATVSGDIFTAGDLFSGLPSEKAERVLGAAPRPGESMTLNARTLMRVAAALDFPWAPASSTDQILIRRAAAIVPDDAVREAIGAALRDKGLDGDFEIAFLNDAAPVLVLPEGTAPSAVVTGLQFDPQDGRFEVRLAAPSRENPLAEATASGRADRLVSVPVVRRTVSRGTIIGAQDIDWISLRARDLQSDTVLEAEQLAGMTPRRNLVSGAPVRGGDLERPQLVSRGDVITITYNAGPLLLTAQGKAMQGGAKGDTIRVVNTASNRSIDALIEDERVVSVIP